MARVVVVGGGYVGLVTAACLAELGNRVSVVEIDRERLDMLRSGRSPVFEPGLPELMRRNAAAGKLEFTAECDGVVPEASVVFIAVQTPAGARGETDTSFVDSAVAAAQPYLRAGATLVMKSTVPPGTADAVAARVPAGVEVVSNPEFLRQGTAVGDFLQPDRVVIGAASEAAARPVVALYRGLRAPMVRCTRRSAELAKYASNAFLAMRVSFINEVSEVCEAVGADVEEVAAIVGGDARIGASFLRSGIGWGGSCFPKDVLALRDTARRAGCKPSLIDAVYEANVRARERAIAHLRECARYRDDPTVGVLGLAFKPGTDDVRGSPPLEIIGRLLEEGFRVRAHDPLAAANASRALPNIRYCPVPLDVADGADALLLATEWPEYLSLDWRSVRARMRGAVLVDGRNALDGPAMRAAGFDYRCFGRGSRRVATNGTRRRSRYPTAAGKDGRR